MGGRSIFVVRRGDNVYDVTISDDVDAQITLWAGLRDRTAISVINYVTSGKSLRYYTDNFLYRYQPPTIRKLWVDAFEGSTGDYQKRVRAGQTLVHFDDFRGVDWALEEIERTKDSEKLQALMNIFVELFRYGLAAQPAN